MALRREVKSTVMEAAKLICIQVQKVRKSNFKRLTVNEAKEAAHSPNEL